MENGNDLLHRAIENKDTIALMVLLNNTKYDINCKNNEKQTLLHHATKTGYVTLVKPLLDNKELADFEF